MAATSGNIESSASNLRIEAQRDTREALTDESDENDISKKEGAERIYNLTFCSFFLVLAHFLSEIFYYHTTELTVGVWAPLIVSSVSILLMAFGFRFPRQHASACNDESTKFTRKKKSS